jgi:hypothetical protein
LDRHFSGGLSVFNKKNKHLSTYSEEDGLPDNTTKYITPDSFGHIWLSTSKGISCFNIKNKKFRNYNLSNGLQAYKFTGGAGLTLRTGEILFGGVNGFNAFNPATLPTNKNVSPVVITSFQVFNKTVPINGEDSLLKQSIAETKEIRLLHSKSVFSFEFIALNYTADEQNQYAYKLQRFDDDWNYVGSQKKSYLYQLSAWNLHL